MAYDLWVSKVNALCFAKMIRERFWCKGKGKSILFIKKFEDEIKSFVIFFVNYWKEERTYRRGGGWMGLIMMLWKTCCWNIPWYVYQNCQFKKGCRLYGTIVLQIVSFFITIYWFHSSLLGLLGRLSSFVFCSRIVSPYIICLVSRVWN